MNLQLLVYWYNLSLQNNENMFKKNTTTKFPQAGVGPQTINS